VRSTEIFFVVFDLTESSVRAVIAARRSTKRFSEAVPTRVQIEALLQAAAAAPDHGLLAPWRFTVLEGDSRALLGDAMAAALKARLAASDPESLARERGKAFRSPVLIVVSVHPEPHPKVPEIEQWVATGAAVQNLWLAAVSMGLGVAWKTGSAAYDPLVKRALGLPSEEGIVGFLHVGTPLAQGATRAVEAASRTRWL
jgi:nitroreductase